MYVSLCLCNTTRHIIILLLQVVEEIVKKVIENVPKPFPITDIMEKYPVKYTESMNTVLVQEVIRYNRLLKIIHSSLQDLRKALKGLVVMSEALETMFNSIFNNEVPEMWAAKVCMLLVVNFKRPTWQGQF